MTKNEARSFIEAIIKVREIIPDEVALENIVLYPGWKDNVDVSVGTRVKYNNKLYKVIQAHTTQATWTPDVANTLFEPIDVSNDGSLVRPFVAAAGMTYYKDKYYFDETNGNVYLCTRDDTGNGTVLHYMPSALVGTYFALAQ